MTKFGLEIKLKAVQQSITIRIENKIKGRVPLDFCGSRPSSSYGTPAVLFLPMVKEPQCRYFSDWVVDQTGI